MKKDIGYTFISILRNKTNLAILERETVSKSLLDYEKCTKEDVFTRIEEDMENARIKITRDCQDEDNKNDYLVTQDLHNNMAISSSWSSPKYTLVKIL